ncbi:unnamed protein product [Cuscuta epithymum]|uniref:Pseudouridine synthase RsuA/RluA-like domain-containing protein n=2 Tax=Cuscuta epithymum TaxID=186058 RepID=A0AAV0CN87_9ASTE|nr:unnamed protein product [Cuscuta epithymum]CAH9131708.1 unnamed protein product [Cuscuta epithymum]
MRKRGLDPHLLFVVRRYSKQRCDISLKERVIRVSNNVASLGSPKEGSKPPQLMSLPPFYGLHLKCPTSPSQPSCRVTAISWLKYYFDEIPSPVIQFHFNKGLVQIECSDINDSSSTVSSKISLRKIRHHEIMEMGVRVYVPVSIVESKISKRFDIIPSGTLYPNADEIAYLQRLVTYKDSALIVLNKPPKLPVKGSLPIHNSMDALAAAALSYDYDVGPRLVHHLDRESSGLLLMGRTEESISLLHLFLSDSAKKKFQSKVLHDSCKTTYRRYWALVIGSPKEKEGLICAPLSKVSLDNGKTERVILAHNSSLESSQEAITEYRVMGPMINGCSWIELRPHTSRKHQLRVHCAEGLGCPIVGDYKYGWFVHKKWKQMPRVDVEPTTGKPYRMRRPEGLDVQKGSVLSKVPLLHLHCRELLLPNIAKLLKLHCGKTLESFTVNGSKDTVSKPDLLRFVAPMPSHMKISWNLMSSYLI